MMRVFMAIFCSLLAVCSVSARDSRQKGTDGQAAIYRLPPFERAVRCTKYFGAGTWRNTTHTWAGGIRCSRGKGIRHAP